MIALVGCKKEYLNNSENSSLQTMNFQTQQDVMLPYRWANPYSVKVLREVRNLANHFHDTNKVKIIQQLNADQYYLYYKIKPDSDVKNESIASWLDADSNRVAVTFPIDSASLYPHKYPQSVLDSLEKEAKYYYTTVPLSQPLPSAIGAELIDTLYLPNQNEQVLDFVLNLATANFSNRYISELHTTQHISAQWVDSIIQSESFMEPQVAGMSVSIDDSWSDPNDPGFNQRKIYFEKVTDAIFHGDRYIHTPVTPEGNITFTDNSLSINEGIKKLKFFGTRFIILPYIGQTNEYGAFEGYGMGRYGYSLLTFEFNNKHLKLRSIDFSGGIGSDALSVIRYLISLPFAKMHTEIVNPFGDIHDFHRNFNHGSEKALWGLTFNAVQEANDYSVSEGLTSYAPFEHKKLQVLCHYSDTVRSSSAPMLSYIGSGLHVGYTNIIFHTLGLSSLIGNVIGGLYPDLIISQRMSNPLNSHELRSTVYHEYAHSLHYFKANKFSNLHWLENINATIGFSGYGSDINSFPGDFFALSEGWADFIGYNYAARKYGTGVIFSELNRWTMTDVTGNYNDILERVPTFWNDFIPRGLFHDLMDVNNSFEGFDNIQGHTILQIYNRFNDATWTIQKFRERWEDEYPSVNNADLFEEYEIDLP